MVVNNLKKIKLPEVKNVADKKEPVIKETPVTSEKTVKAKASKKTPSIASKSKVSPKNKKAIEKSYQEKIQQAIKELPIEASEPIKTPVVPKMETAAKAKTAEAVSKPMAKPAVKPTSKETSGEPQINLDIESIRSAVLAELKSSSPTPSVKKEKNRVLPILPVIKEKNLEQVEKIIDTPSKIHIHIGGKRIFSVHHPKILIKPLTSLAVGLVLLLLVSLAGVYVGGWDNAVLKKAYGALPLPAVYIDGQLVSLGAFYEDTDAFLAYQKRSGVLTTAQIAKEQVLKSLVEKNVIAGLAKNKGLSVNQDEIKQELNFIIASSGSSQELGKLVNDLYGWNLEQYQEKIISPLLLAQKVMNDFNLTGGNAEIKKSLQAKRQQVVEQAADFTVLAAEINEDDSKFAYGDLGWFKLGDILPEFEIQFLNLEPGELSQVFESSAGYHAVKLLEKSSAEDGEVSYHLAQLFLKKARFEDYLNEQIKKAKVVTLIKI